MDADVSFADDVFHDLWSRADNPELVALALCNVVADFVEWFSLGIDLHDDTVASDFGELMERLWRRYAMHGIAGLDNDADHERIAVTFCADPATGIAHAVDVSSGLTLCGLPTYTSWKGVGW